MSEADVRARERAAFVAGANWYYEEQRNDRRPLVEEVAAKRYPELPIRQGPSGAWYRIVPSGLDLMVWRWDTETGAEEAWSNYFAGILAGDELAVADLLKRHAESAR